MFPKMMFDGTDPAKELLGKAAELRPRFEGRVHERVTSSAYAFAADTAAAVVHTRGQPSRNWDILLDKILTGRVTGVPLMLALLALVFWITIKGANVPSFLIASVLMEKDGLAGFLRDVLGIDNSPVILSVSLYEVLHATFRFVHAPWWLTGFLMDGVYLGLAWVVSVMLPPMTIFFPLFTLLEDFGYLPRIAFNMDRFLRAAGAHGKQALTMAMGFGCNAAGITACRIIESPRERLIAILTNNFMPCNGRWPTLIMVSSLFIAAAFPAGWTSAVTVACLVAITLIGIGATLVVSFALSRTLLRGVASSFTLEMPPYRRPQLGRILYTSLIDRTIFVLWRAILMAAPAGGLIWLLGAIHVGELTAYAWLRNLLDPIGYAMGLDGVILIAYIFAIPANEIIVPTIIMGYMNASTMLELDNPATLFLENGWTLTTAVCLLLFSLLHYPCSTTTMTIWKEAGSAKWATLANLIPLTVAVVVCFLVAQFSSLLGWR